METEIIILIIMQVCGLIISIATPIITILDNIARRLERSSCCGSNIELHDAKSFVNDTKKRTSQESGTQEAINV